MRFSSQNLPDMENVSAEFIERAFDDRAIGAFAHLWLSNDIFIQAGSKGRPSSCVPPDDPHVKELWNFIQRTGSEPWTLQYDRWGRKEGVPGSRLLDIGASENSIHRISAD